ncbi:ATP-binding protein [Zobellia nedashkovskayae]|uniref:ATP-binding protein n=1 Tax=Zobellia nedashkovskayae TaxID=2779510 RepID=UPI00188CEDE8|nr:ATP-binding protein [Zobellia nedashkovskayae]
MDNTQKTRIKSAMIVYALETSLGNYVIENEMLEKISDSNKNNISDREKSKGINIEKDNVSVLVESSYLDEVFNLAIDTTEGTSLYSNMKELKNLCSFLGIFDIRNAISHPNRPFPDSYWFRSATIASDPLIEKLGLGGVRQALNSAIEESLNVPPEEWFDNVKWAIPNTLPISFDHEITGLLGRDKEFKELHKTISSPRNSLIAVVAPGGIGKTALILQFLKDLSLSPTYSSSISTIVFCTLKNERLTADGIELIEAINGIVQIKASILTDLNNIYGENSYSSFEEACEKLETDKILICIDNLETLLMHSQEEFIEFNQSLPMYWRVIVTSRISIDSATTVTLDPLGKRHAVSLSRNYFRKRGIQNIKQSIIENIADRANNNPLAIRLTIDLYLKGADISQSIEQSQKNIAAFSYKNLIESLSDNSIAILEAIYVLGESNKSELVDFLELTNEEIAEATNELSKTSLIVRGINEIGLDCYKLSESIRDLLLVNPKNIEVRTNIAESLKKTKSKILEQTTRNKQLGLSEFDENYVTPNTDRSIHSLIVDLNKYFSKPYAKRIHSELISLKGKFADLIIYNPKDYQLNYHYSRVLKALKDKSGELKILKQSDSFNPRSPRTINAIGMHHFYNSDYEKALEVFNGLHDMKLNLPANSSGKFAYSLTKLRLLCLLYLGHYDELIKTTENWEKDPNWSAIYGTYRASTIKRKNEGKRYNIQDTEKAISAALEIFEKIFSSGDYPIVACIEGNKILKEFDFVISKPNYSKKIINKYITFISTHFFNLVSRLKNESVDSKESKELLSKVYSANIKPNPLHKVSWYSETSNIIFDKEHIEELESEGYEIVEVYHIPEKEYGASNFIFAKNKDEVQFYLHVDHFDGGWNRWGYIKNESKLGIDYDQLLTNGQPTPATVIIEVEQHEI